MTGPTGCSRGAGARSGVVGAAAIALAAGLLAAPPEGRGDEAPSAPVVRYGSIDRVSGGRVVGVIGSEAGGSCVSGERGPIFVPLEDTAAFRVVDLPLPGALPGSAFAVGLGADGAVVGGTLLLGGDPSVVTVRTPTGLAVLDPRVMAVARGIYQATPASCSTAAGASHAPIPTAAEAPLARRAPEPLVLVDRRGHRLLDDVLDEGDVFAIRGEPTRSWKRARLSIAGFAEATGLEWAEERVRARAQGQIDRKDAATIVFVTGIVGLGVSIGHAAALGGASTAGLEFDADPVVAAGFAAPLIGISAATIITGAIKRAQHIRRARMHRRENLREAFDLDQLRAAVAGEPDPRRADDDPRRTDRDDEGRTDRDDEPDDEPDDDLDDPRRTDRDDEPDDEPDDDLDDPRRTDRDDEGRTDRDDEPDDDLDDDEEEDQELDDPLLDEP